MIKKITIVGTGYVGLVTGACLAETGHDVICSDIDSKKIEMLNSFKMPIFEIGLEELVKKNVNANRLKFTTDVVSSIRESDVVFSCVGTPMGEDFKADLKYVKEVAKVFAQNLNSFKLFVNKSTVPVGTCDIVRKMILNENPLAEFDFEVVSNPEFLREGAAVKDFLNPNRIVIGASSQKARDIMEEIYRPFKRSSSPIIFTDVKSAELIKYASNSMLATRISFMNEIANFCDRVGADVTQVARGMGFDSRIGPKFLQAGIGYGGSCFPKDVVALIESGREVGFEFDILNSVTNVNERQKSVVVEKLLERFNGDLKGRTFAVWGLAFKPRTDDVREAPAAVIISKLIELGAKVKAYDNVAKENFQRFNSHLNVEYCNEKYLALKDVDGLLLLTEWDEFRILDIDKMDEMKHKIFIDGRNIIEPEFIEEKGFEYFGMGRMGSRRDKKNLISEKVEMH